MSSADNEYDIIFVGGGAAGCVTSSRLATADPSLKILVLEGGGHTQGIQEHVQPALFVTHLAPGSKTVTFHAAKPSDHVGGRSIVIPSGRCVGGGSSVNFMMYTRAAASDYDDWETVFGNSGWGSKDLLPLLKKTETYQAAPDKATHGYSGPLKVSFGGTYTAVGKQFLDLAAEYDKERGVADDINGLYSCNKYGRWEKWIDGESGRRQDVPHHFIYDKLRENLHVMAGCKVKRVIFENNRAVGVEYVNDPTTIPDGDQTIKIAKASKLVVLSGGAFGSPQVLERSGIGAKKILEKYGVEQIVDLPGVGESYQDHNVTFVPYFIEENAVTLDDVFVGSDELKAEYLRQWKEEGRGLLAHNGIDVGVKLRPNEEDLKELGPEFKARWESYFVNAPDKPVIWMGAIAGFVGDRSAAPNRKYMSMGYYTEYPVSTGSVHISSGEDPHAPADFDTGFLRDPADVATLRWGYKKSREFARRMGAFRGVYEARNPQFPKDSSVAYKENEPVDVAAPDLIYSTLDNKVIDNYHRENVQTAWHSLGTCAMKPREQGGVVDGNLNVYGVEGLKVADLSIAPGNVASNTYSTALTIGEKAAVIIGDELKIRGV